MNTAEKIEKLHDDIQTLKQTLKFLQLNPKYDDGSNARELARKEKELEKLLAGGVDND
ncbi:hypothetical protein [Enterococcus gallinarum]|uniref:hypothetical protein n=1 Tax=Enterococcus gallinarum TaxID=1353 RepID=UPI001AD7CA86|nr:hypothetical protein [Enterococcus gallinarum]